MAALVPHISLAFTATVPLAFQEKDVRSRFLLIIVRRFRVKMGEAPDELNPYRCVCQSGFPGRNCEGRVCKFERDNDPACFLDTDLTTWYRSSEQLEGSGIKAFEGTHYLYLETSWRSFGQNNYFYDKDIPFEDTDHCLTFAYYMSGESVGQLRVLTYNGNFREHFKKQGTQGGQWHIAHLDIPLDQSTLIVFQGTMENSRQYFSSEGLIAIDDVKLLPTRCA